MAKVLPFPAPTTERPAPAVPQTVPSWQILRFPVVGSDAVRLIAFDGAGYPIYELTCPCNEDLGLWETVMERQVAKRREGTLTPFSSASRQARLTAARPS